MPPSSARYSIECLQIQLPRVAKARKSGRLYRIVAELASDVAEYEAPEALIACARRASGSSRAGPRGAAPLQFRPIFFSTIFKKIP